MKKLPLVIFVFIMLGAVCSGVCNYKSTENRITRDVNNALKLTLAEMPTNVVNADTISCYRSHLTIAELKDTACIAMTWVSRAGRQETQMVAQANCGFMTILMLSDQRASGALLFVGILWIMCSLWYMRRFKPELFVAGLSYGSIVFATDKFLTAICDRLWPKKPDASDTLYTLIKRVKPILEANSNLKIESDRGKSYTLKIK